METIRAWTGGMPWKAFCRGREHRKVPYVWMPLFLETGSTGVGAVERGQVSGRTHWVLLSLRDLEAPREKCPLWPIERLWVLFQSWLPPAIGCGVKRRSGHWEVGKSGSRAELERGGGSYGIFSLCIESKMSLALPCYLERRKYWLLFQTGKLQ